jgi:SHS2 domain-containing protein
VLFRKKKSSPKAVADAQSIQGRYSTIEHTADIGIAVEAPTIEDLFATGACAMFDLMVDLSKVEPSQRADISLKADSLEDLFVTWLNELVFRADVNGMFFSRFEVESVTPDSIEASVWGEPYKENTHRVGQNVKAATYHELKVVPIEGGWRATVILDV